MHRLLLVSSNAERIAPLRDELTRAGFPAKVSSPQIDALTEASISRPPEVIFWDAETDREPLLLLFKRLRIDEENPAPLTIALVSASDLSEQLSRLGDCDDFLTLPSRPGEALARLTQLLQRRRGIQPDQMLSFSGLTLDLANYVVTREGERMDLTFKEYELLRFLATHRGRAFTRDTLLQQVWGHDFYGGSRTVDVHIRRLRAKLGPTYEGIIETVRNVGYRFGSDV